MGNTANIVFSGMRPTGALHLGHLVGALQKWKLLQEQYQCFFMVADWHALMSEYEDASALPEYCIEMVTDWLSVGIDPDKSVLFIQSYVPGHLELNMFLSVFTPLSWLERNPTYKEQLREITTRHLTTYGFLGYPVLQAADILLYKASYVPVGMDQLAHLEITREMVRKFNTMYSTELLIEPQPIVSEVPKLLGLDNRKMSKSYGNCLSLTETKESLRKKVMQMITDPARVKKNDPGHPEICTVFSYLKVFEGKQEKMEERASFCRKGSLGCIECKQRLADVLSAFLMPIQEKRAQFSKDTVVDILKAGTKKALAVSENTMTCVRKTVGMIQI